MGDFLGKQQQSVNKGVRSSGMYDPYHVFGKDQVDTAGEMPSNYPSYIGMDPQQTGQAGALDKTAMNAYTNNAMRSGPSAGTNWALQNNAAQSKLGLDQTNKMAGGQAATAQSNLAMRGGLSGGANERVQQNATNNALDLSQKTQANSSNNARGILMEDENNRMGQLGGANSMAQGAAQQGLATNQAQSNELANRNKYNLGMYQTQMAGWGAGKTADATQNAGGKKG